MASDDAPPPQDAALENDVAGNAWPPWAKPVLEAMRSVPSISRAARTVGVARTTIQRLSQRDEAFALAMHDAREEALDTLEEVMLLRARTGQPTKKTVTKTLPNGTTQVEVTEDIHLSDVLGMFYLKRWRPEYRESYRVETSGPGGGPIQIELEGRLADAVSRFDAEVVRLAAARAAAEDPQ